MGSRFPFASYPRGWFVVAFADDVAAGAVKTVHHFGQDIVLFRTERGTLAALDRTCPHLGAHLGVGRVDGECLRCPFHDWAFDATGRCVEIPGAKKIPAKASVSAWPVREQDGVVMVYFCPQGAAPTWEPPTLHEAGWTTNRTVRWQIESHPQEVAESAIDVHHAPAAEVRAVEQDGHAMRVLWHMPDQGVERDVQLHGLGLIVSTSHATTSGQRTRRRIYATPIDEQRIALFGVHNTAVLPDPAETAALDERAFEAFCAEFPRDFPIWETKAYLDRPLVDGHGPIGRFREWAHQFYDEPIVDVDQVTEQRGALVRLTDWLHRASKPGERPTPDPRTATFVGSHRKPRRFSSVEAYFDSLPARFDAHAAGDLEAVFQWILTGDPPRAHYAAIKDGQVALARGRHAQPTVTIEMSAADYLSMINGELSDTRAFSAGRGTLRGPALLAKKMQRLFPPDRVVH